MFKKLLRLALCTGVLTTALLCTASAATENYTTDRDGTVTYDATGKEYSATYSGKTVSGNQYVLMVVQGTPSNYSMNNQTIQYIDQKAATETGVNFDRFIPKSVPDCVVLLGGAFSDGTAPKLLGTLIGQGVTVSGSVGYAVPLDTRPVTVSLYDASNVLVASTNSLKDGTYSMAGVPEGNYKVIYTKGSYLTYTKNSVTVSGNTNLDTVTLKAGDVTMDGTIEALDITPIINNYGDPASQYPTADVNGDNTIEALDLSTVLTNYGEQSVVLP